MSLSPLFNHGDLIKKARVDQLKKLLPWCALSQKEIKDG